MFQYKIHFQPGKNNIADPLSRLSQVDWSKGTMNEVFEDNLIATLMVVKPCALSIQEIGKASEQDEELSDIMRSLLSGLPIKKIPFIFMEEELGVLNGILMRGCRIITPAVLWDQVLKLAHEGHRGIVKMKDRLRAKVWWPNIDKEAERAVKSCGRCQRVVPVPHPVPISRRNLPQGAWQELANDFKESGILLTCIKKRQYPKNNILN